jgi:ribulose-5-phosphate 4-epimerase/fuculose-1-phosphate aldolase
MSRQSDDEEKVRTELIQYSSKLYQSGLIFSSGGNTSVRRGDTVWISRTGATLGEMSDDDIVRCSLDGNAIEGGVPSKEFGMHLAMYRARPEVNAVMHPHPPYCIAFSALQSEPSRDSMLPYTAGFYLRAGRVPMVGYYHSGSTELHQAVAELAPYYHVILLQNHGLIAGGLDMLTTLNVVEEVEQNCRIALLVGADASHLTPRQCAEIDEKLERVWS